MQEMKPIKEGKVREIYDNKDSLIMVATDRISCFDVILKNEVTKKGTVLTQMSKFWFDMTQDILPNHMISTDVKRYAGVFPAGEIRRQQHDVQKTGNASGRMYCPWIYYRKRLDKLSGDRYGLRYSASGRSEGIR